MKKLVVTLLVIPLIIVMAVKDPTAAGHLIELIITWGAKLLDAVATLLSNLLGAAHH